MNARQTLFAVLLVLAASCGGGGGGSRPADAAEPAPSYALLAVNVDGNTADVGGVPALDSSQGTPWSVTLQFETNTEARRVRLYLSGGDVLGDVGVGQAAAGPHDLPFYDQVIGAGAADPLALSCTYSSGARVLTCGGDTADELDRDTWLATNGLAAFIIARSCSTTRPGRCDVWPVPVHFVF